LRLLENKVVELNIVDRASDSTIGRILKNILKPHLKQQWVIPPKANIACCAGRVHAAARSRYSSGLLG
jgi:hypothetical protein